METAGHWRGGADWSGRVLIDIQVRRVVIPGKTSLLKIDQQGYLQPNGHFLARQGDVERPLIGFSPHGHLANCPVRPSGGCRVKPPLLGQSPVSDQPVSDEIQLARVRFSGPPRLQEALLSWRRLCPRHGFHTRGIRLCLRRLIDPVNRSGLESRPWGAHRRPSPRPCSPSRGATTR